MLLKKTQKKPTNSIRYPIKRYFHRCRRAFTIQYKTFCVQYPLCIYVRSYIMLYVKLNISLKFIALSLWKVCKYERELLRVTYINSYYFSIVNLYSSKKLRIEGHILPNTTKYLKGTQDKFKELLGLAIYELTVEMQRHCFLLFIA